MARPIVWSASAYIATTSIAWLVKLDMAAITLHHLRVHRRLSATFCAALRAADVRYVNLHPNSLLALRARAAVSSPRPTASTLA